MEERKKKSAEEKKYTGEENPTQDKSKGWGGGEYTDVNNYDVMPAIIIRTRF